MQVGLKTDTENISFVCLFVCFFYFPPGKNKIKKKERKKERRREREREEGRKDRDRRMEKKKKNCLSQVPVLFKFSVALRPQRP